MTKISAERSSRYWEQAIMKYVKERILEGGLRHRI